MSTKATDDDEAAAAVAAAAVTVAVAAAIATAVFQRHIQALHCYRATLENLVILWNIPCCHCCVSACTNCTKRGDNKHVNKETSKIRADSRSAINNTR